MDYATITNCDGYTVFAFNDTRLRFKAPFSLEYYDSVQEWDNGYIVARAKYTHSERLEEEYIDLIPILNDLYIEPTEFLKPIKRVVVKND